MKEFLVEILFFISTLMVSSLILVFISDFDNLDKATSENSNIKTLQSASNFDGLDILFVGNSYCYSAIQPSIFGEKGYRIFNLGVATSGHEFYELIIGDYIENVNAYPKMIFMLLSPMTFSSQADDYVSYPIHRYLKDPKSNIDILYSYKHYEKILPMLRKSVTKSISNIIRFNSFRNQNVEPVGNRGYIGSDDIVSKKEIERTEHLYVPLQNEVWRGGKIDRLMGLTTSLEEKGIEVVYFELPTYQLSTYFSANYLRAYEDSIDRLMKKNEVLRIPPSLFTSQNYRNIDHMNSSGAEIATIAVLQYLEGKRESLAIN